MQSRYYMKDEVPFSDFPVYNERSGRGRSSAAMIFLVLFLIVAAVLGGLYFLGKARKSQSTASVTPTTAPTPTLVPTSTPTASASGSITPSPTSGTSAKLDRSKLTVSVLNGSGVKGAANATAATLRNLGYAVGATGNATRFNYTGVTILIKKAKSTYGNQLKTDLNAQGASVTTDDTIATDAVVIVGK